MPKTNRKKDDRVHSLTDLEVREVSLVDRPANGRRFSMVKNEDGSDMNGEERIEIDLNDDAEVNENVENVETIGSVLKSVGEKLSNESVEKALTIPDEVKGKAYKMISESMHRLDTVISALYASGHTEESDTTDFSKVIGSELMEISSALSGMGKKLGGAKSTAKAEEDPEDFSTALATIGTQLETLMSGESTNEQVEKAGAKMARGRLKAFEASLASLTKLLEELRGAQTQKTEAQVDALAKGLENAKSTVAKQAAELKKLRKAVKPSAVISVEKGEAFKQESEATWPRDLNNDPASRKIDKSVDFR